ncbi:MAG: alcohol dehydrogenase catalytic domain-containing protein [Actinomycetales bacterium]
MKAVVLESLRPIEENPLSYKEVDRPTAGPGEVLIQVAACGVCRSNLHMIEGDWAPGTPSFTPIIPGHEVVGTVAEVGAGVDTFVPGDRVGVQPLFSTCGHCRYCLSGLDHLCQSKEITGESVNGGYAEFMVSKAAHTYPLPDNLDFAEAAPLFCPGITAYGSVAKAELAPGKSVAIFGMGGVGHMVLQMAALFGADVFAVSRGRNHLELAEELGATGVAAEEADEVLGARGGVDASIVFAPSDAVVQQALRLTRPGGTVVVGVNGNVGPLPFATEKTVVGSLLGTRQQMLDVLALAAAGKIRANCETFPLGNAADALQKLKAGEVRARAVLVV